MTSTTSIARPAPDAQRRPTRHRRNRRTSPRALQLRQQWRAPLGPAARIADAAENYVLHVVLWGALLALLGFGLALDTHSAAVYGAAALTGFFKRRPVEDTAAEVVEDTAAPPSSPRPPAEPVAFDDPLVDPADDGLGVPVFAADTDPAPPERTDIIPAVRRLPAPGEVSAAALQRRAARLEAAVAERDRVIEHMLERGAEQLEELATRLRTAELDRDEADKAARVLRDALDRDRPAPDALELAERLRAVYMIPTSYSSDTEVRWRRVAQAAIDAVRGLWPIDRWPLSDAERRGVERDQTHPAEGWPQTSPGDGAEAEDSPPAAAPPAPGDPTPALSTAALSAAADSHLEALSLVIARRDLEITGSQWPRLTNVMREHYRCVAAEVVEAGWRPPLDDMLVPRGRRANLARVLVAHEQLADGGCRCGWAGVAIWHAEHAAEQLLATGVAR